MSLGLLEGWKRKLSKLGFEGCISSWPDSFGDDLSVEAIPNDRKLKPVQSVFKVGANDSRTASELLRDFRACLKSVYEQCCEQVEDANDIAEARKALQDGKFTPLERVWVKQKLGL